MNVEYSGGASCSLCTPANSGWSAYPVHIHRVGGVLTSSSLWRSRNLWVELYPRVETFCAQRTHLVFFLSGGSRRRRSWDRFVFSNPVPCLARVRCTSGILVGETRVPLGRMRFTAFPTRPFSRRFSSDILRHPLSSKALHLLQKIMHLSEAGDHTAAIGALHEALIKQPAAKPYIDSLLGSEYLQTRQLTAAA